MSIKDKLKKIKAAFDAAPAPAAEPAPAPVMKTVGYNLADGTAVYLQVEDDGSGLDVGDKVFSDEAMTMPLADGNYKAAEGDFSFDVVAGAVSAVNDPSGTGIGTPIQKAAPAAAEPAEPVFKADDLKTPAQMLAAFEKFEGGVPDIQSLSVMVKALMGNVFGWQIAEQANKTAQAQAISVYQTGFESQKVTIDKQDKVIKELFAIVEDLANVPTTDPVDVPKSAKTEKFEKKQSRLESIAAGVSELRKNYN
jgi:hypothetical protein